MSCRGRGNCPCSHAEATIETDEPIFEVGDRVRATSELSGDWTIGTIVSVIPSTSYPYIVEHDHPSLESTYGAWELELLLVDCAPPAESASDDESILEEAQGLVYGARNVSYGHPADDYERTAKIWSAILGVEVTAAQAALCMVGVKISRECHSPKRDNRVDGAGYFAVVDRIRRREDGLE